MKICMIGLGSIGQRHLRNIDYVLRGRGLSATFDVVEPRELDYLDAETRKLVANRYATPVEIGDRGDSCKTFNRTVAAPATGAVRPTRLPTPVAEAATVRQRIGSSFNEPASRPVRREGSRTLPSHPSRTPRW